MIDFPEMRRAWVDTFTGTFQYREREYKLRNSRTTYVLILKEEIVAEVILYKTCKDLYKSMPDSIPILLLPMGSMVTD